MDTANINTVETSSEQPEVQAEVQLEAQAEAQPEVQAEGQAFAPLPPTVLPVSTPYLQDSLTAAPRTSLKRFGRVCMALAAVFLLLTVVNSWAYIAFFPFMVIFSFMFFILSRSPKEHKRLNENTGMSKVHFIVICVVIALALFGGLWALFGPNV